MTTFDPTLHPRGHQMNAGAFAERSNSDPETSLSSAPEGSTSTALVLRSGAGIERLASGFPAYAL